MLSFQVEIETLQVKALEFLHRSSVAQSNAIYGQASHTHTHTHTMIYTVRQKNEPIFFSVRLY